MKRIIGGLVSAPIRQAQGKSLNQMVSVPMASTPLSHRKAILLTDTVLLTDTMLLTERSRRQQGMMTLKEMLG